MAKAKKAGFEDSMYKLEEILKTIQSPDTSLDDSIKLYADAAQLIVQCREQLSDAAVKIEEIDKTIQQAEDEDEL